MSWVYLGAAILFEVCGTTCMKLADGFTKPLPSVFVFVFYGLSFWFLTLALKRLEISTTYAIWSGVGTAAIAVIGAVVFHETMSPTRLLCLLLIIVGVIGLNLSVEASHP